MIPPLGGRALESKERCHDLPIEIMKKRFVEKKYAFS
jgi:hypothetical protein